jgi:hypothetical protein
MARAQDMAARLVRWRDYVVLALEEVCLAERSTTSGGEWDGSATAHHIHTTAVRPGARLVILTVTAVIRADTPTQAALHCIASDSTDCGIRRVSPRLVGRKNFRPSLLIGFLQQTLDERRDVLAALVRGAAPPFAFDTVSWEVPPSGDGED